MSREIFQVLQRPRLKRSILDLSYGNLFSARFGDLIPTYWEEVIPTDKGRFTCAPFVRATPLSSPMMGQVDMHTYYFYVPFRLIWDDFEEFITGGRLGTSAPVMPYAGARDGGNLADAGSANLWDFFSLARTEKATGTSSPQFKCWRPAVNMLLCRAYWKIYDDYFRDQNLETSLFDSTQPSYISTGSGLIDSQPGWNNGIIQGHNFFFAAQKAWSKDLFTSALPFAQRGAPVTIPIASTGIVSYQVDSSGAKYDIVAGTSGSDPNIVLSGGNRTTSVGKLISEGNAPSFNINDLREASAIQRFLEFNALGGSRYKEQVAMHFGGNVADYRLDRPEFIAGVKTPIISNSVTQSSQTNADSVLGTLGGNFTGAGVMKPRSYRFPEHGVVIGISAIIPKSQYSQGVARFNLKRDKFDFFFPYFENLGEQEIYNAELYAQGSAADLNSFGYGPRYYEYKHRENEVHGDMKGDLAYWTPQRLFSKLPALNPDFVHVDPSKEESLNNIFAVTDSKQDQFYVYMQNSARFSRPMSKYSKFLLR